MDQLTDITCKFYTSYRIFVHIYAYEYILLVFLVRSMSIRASKLKSNETRSFDESNLDHRSIK